MINHNKIALIGTILAVTLVLTMVLPQIGLANDNYPSSKCAVAGVQNKAIKIDKLGTYPKIKLMETWIKTAEQKCLVISVSSEIVLLTDTKITGKGNVDLDDQDIASVVVWVEVDKKAAFPKDVVFAERIQILKGKLSSVITNPDGTVEKFPEEIELILKTTEANSFNFLAAVDSGVHEVVVYATITLAEKSSSKEVSPDPMAAIGDRTLVVEEVRLVKDVI